MTELATQRQAETAAKGPKPKAALNGARSFWLKQLHSWHWISAAVSLTGMILFAVTGITLNHAASIPGDPVTVEQTAAPGREATAGPVRSGRRSRRRRRRRR